METSCPVCGRSKKKFDKNDPRLLEILKQFNKKNIDELSPATQEVIKMAEYTFLCNCPLDPMRIQNARMKRNENTNTKAE